MGDMASPGEIRALGAAMRRRPTRVSIRVLSADLDHQVQRAIKALRATDSTYDATSHQYTNGNTHFLVSTLDAEHFRRLIYDIVLAMADLSTSRLVSPGDSMRLYFVKTTTRAEGKADVVAWAMLTVNQILGAIKEVTSFPRRWARRYAETAYDAFEQHAGYSPQLANKHGYPVEARSVAFDFADAIPLHRLNNTQLTAINNAKWANVAARTPTSQTQTSTHTFYHMGAVQRVNTVRPVIEPPVRAAITGSEAQ